MEFKKTTGEINEAMQSICAMLNKHGYGTIYFGVLPNGEPKGQMINESTLRDISRKIYETIVPQIVPTIEKRIIDDKEIIEVSFKGSDRPYSTKGVYYIYQKREFFSGVVSGFKFSFFIRSYLFFYSPLFLLLIYNLQKCDFINK